MSSIRNVRLRSSITRIDRLIDCVEISSSKMIDSSSDTHLRLFVGRGREGQETRERRGGEELAVGVT